MQSSQRSPHSLGYRLAIALLAVLAAAKPILFDSIDPDCFWHLRVAGELRAQGIHPIVDTLCFASIRTPWTPYSWLAELGMADLWNAAGWRGAVLTTAAMNGAFVLLLAAICTEVLTLRRQRRELTAIFAVLAGCVWSLAYLSFRPATLAIDLLALAAWLLARDRRLGSRSRAVWLVVPIALLLANVHLTAVLLPIGMLLWLWPPLPQGEGWGEGRRALDAHLRTEDVRPTHPHPNLLPKGEGTGLRRRIVLVAFTALASIATPMLPGVLRAIGDYSSHDVMVASTILAEMRPFYAGSFGAISATLVGVTVLAALLHRRQLSLGDWLLFAFAIVLLFRLGRFSPIFAIVGVPVAAMTWRPLSDSPLQRRAIAIALAALLLLCVGRIVVNWPGPSVSLDAWLNRNASPDSGYPTDAVAWVDANVAARSGRIINEFNWGGYLGWRLGGQYQTLMDGRTQVQSESFWRSTYLGDDASRQQVILASRADCAIVPTRGSIFLQSLRTLGWRQAYQDARATVFVPPTMTGK